MSIKSIKEAGKPIAQAYLDTWPTEALFKIHVRKLVLDRFALDSEVKNVSVADVSREDIDLVRND
jgi:hypothetical protein